MLGGVTARSDDESVATATVSVVPAELRLYPDTLTLAPGDVEWFQVTGVTGAAQPVVYASGNEAVATAEVDGLCGSGCPWVYVVGHAPGTTTIAATLSGETATAVVHVVEP